MRFDARPRPSMVTMVAIVLAVGAAINALPSPPQRSVILALWDAEEDGLVGSEYFSNNPLVSLASIKGYVNLDIQGANLLPSLQGITTLIAAESGGSILQTLATNATQNTPLDYRVFSRLFGQDRSDHASFIDDGVPVVFMSDGTGSCYHTPGDDSQVVDLGKLAAESEVAFRLVVELTEASVPPSFTATGLLDTVYQDAVEVLDLIDVSLADLSLFPSATQTQILNQRAIVEGIVNAGPGSFTFSDGFAAAGAASILLTAVENLPCNGFLPGFEVPTSTAPIRVGLILILVAIGTLFAKRRGAIA